MTLSSNVYYSLLFSSVKSTELGMLNFSINTQLVKPINSLSVLLLASIVKVQATVLFSSTLLLLIVIFSLFLLLNNISLLYMTVTHKISIEFNIMIVWGQINFQEGMSVIIELLNYFHDYIIVILILIITFVTYIFVYVSASPYVDKYTIDSHLLETVWTVVPIIILLFIAFPSLYLLYLITNDIESTSTLILDLTILSTLTWFMSSLMLLFITLWM